MAAYQDLVDVNVPTRLAADLTGVSRATAHRHANPKASAPDRRTRTPSNRLTDAETAHVLQVLNSDRFVDATPLQVYSELLDEGLYLCSVSTMYRILAANRLVVDRRRQARHPARVKPELVADGPGQVYSWDITKLAGPTRGVYYDAYVMIDIYSRYIVAAEVHHRESGERAEAMMRQVFGVHGIPKVVHADRGTSMTSKTVADLLADLQVTRSHSRPKVSNDNPYSEAWFKTLKYAPVFPERFGSLEDARAFMDRFVDHYNHHHRHSSIGLHTPADVHYGLTAAVRQRRHTALAHARNEHPERFGGSTDLQPQILKLPTQAWINPPDQTEQETAA